MKIVVAVLLATVAVLAWLLNAEVATSRQLSGQIADKTARENLELQEKCAQQAMKIFNDPYYKADDRYKPGGSSQSYRSHYNAKLNKCFMTTQLISNLESVITVVSEDLLDAYEQREYASYMWYPSDEKDKSNWRNWPMQPKICRLIHSTATERECKSHEEYKAFVATYME